MAVEELLAEFDEVAERGYERLRQDKERSSRKYIGCFPMYLPEELIHAAGALPVGIFGGPRRISLANSRLQTFACWPVRSALEWGLQGGMDFLDGIVFPDICDALQVLSEIWRNELPNMFSDFLVQPARLDTPLARTYYLKELSRFKLKLEDFLGSQATPEALRESIVLYNRHRQMLRELVALRQAAPGLISAGDVANVITASMLMSKEEHTQMLDRLLRELRDHPRRPASGPRLALFGFLCDRPYPGILELLAELGAEVVADDLWTGSRYIATDVPENGDPLEALVDKLMNTVPCWTKHNGDRWVGDYVLQLVEQSGARGVVAMPTKYCEPVGFDYPDLKDLLAEREIPHLLLEIDEAQSLSQAKTRIQAFLEMIGGS